MIKDKLHPLDNILEKTNVAPPPKPREKIFPSPKKVVLGVKKKKKIGKKFMGNLVLNYRKLGLLGSYGATWINDYFQK